MTAPAASPSAGGLRILLVAPQPFFEARGTPLNVLQMVRVLCGTGHEVHLVTYALGGPVSVEGRFHHHRAVAVPGIRTVPIGFSWRKVVLDATVALRTWGLLLRRRFDVVHAVEESVFFTLPPAKLRGLPVVYDLDSIISHQLAYSGVVRNRTLLRGVRALEAAALRRADLALTVSRSLTDAVRKLVPAVPVVQIEDCPVEESLRDPDPAAVEALRARYGLGGAPVAVYTGNLETYQGVDLLLEAWPRVLARCSQARLLVVGGEPADVAAAKASLPPEVAASVAFAGKMPPSAIADLMAVGSALVSPRRAGENTPLKLYSYMHSGVPIVATDLWTHRQVLDATTAVLCAPTPDDLARALAEVLTDPAAFAPRGRAARERVDRDYSPAVFARKLVQAYERLGAAAFSRRSSSI